MHVCIKHQKEQVAGTVCRQQQERGRCRNYTQETSKESRLQECVQEQELCAGKFKREKVAGNVCREQQESGSGRGQEMCAGTGNVSRKPQEREGCRNCVQGIAGGGGGEAAETMSMKPQKRGNGRKCVR